MSITNVELNYQVLRSEELISQNRNHEHWEHGFWFS
jgi:hypothetical protein